ncbi:MAG: hypothetical protein KME05_12745 [Gloeocapsa sp. UFS-A4-WI-NPMV-4B04]|jgi:hypothetical protein|nr:hypothetical protein [Gloeocapsa sp. UFS-A4-WI-NPMV-4B04]
MNYLLDQELLKDYSEFEDEYELGMRGQAGRNPAQKFAAYLKRQGFLPTIHFTQRFLKRVLSRGLRFDPRTFRSEFYQAKHYRQTRPGYNTRFTMVRGIPIVYRPGGEDGNRIVLVTVLEEGKLPPVAPASPPPQREAEVELEQLLESLGTLEGDYTELDFDLDKENATAPPTKRRSGVQRTARSLTGSPDWLRKFTEPLHSKQARNAETEILQKLDECHKLGARYEHLVRQDLPASGIQGVKGPGYITDIGPYYEVTTEGRNEKNGFSSRKLIQIGQMLEHEGKLFLTVPRLSPKAQRQLIELGEKLKSQGKKVFLIVRQTQP